MSRVKRRKTVVVRVGHVQVGGGAPIVVQAMTNTPTADAEATARQVCALAEAGAELVRFTVDTREAARAAPEIAGRVRDAGQTVPLIGDFHYNGHTLLREFPECARILDKYRVNPGNVGRGQSCDRNFAAFCRIAVDNNKAVRIGVNSGSLNPDLVERKMRQNTEQDLGKEPDEILNECLILSTLESTEMALSYGLRKDQIIISAKSSSPRHLIALYRELADCTDQPLHLGLTEAGMGLKGLVWSASAMAVLLEEGIGDTVRVSLTPRPGGDRCEEVYAACELLQALDLRAFMPTITACPGCGRTNGTLYQELAERTREYIQQRMPVWRREHPGVETMKLAVMGCVVNGPGESKAADIGISLPGKGEAPTCPVYIDGQLATRLRGTPEELLNAFRQIIDDYVARHYPGT